MKKCTYNLILRHIRCRTAELQPSLCVSFDRIPFQSLFHHKLRKNWLGIETLSPVTTAWAMIRLPL